MRACPEATTILLPGPCSG